jgi:exodeoxyribonuclease VII large subunit
VRGGGSRTELGHFDTLPIGEAVCTLGIPLVCGIGHQLDRCLIDEIARSFKTPTAAASALVELVNGFVSELDSLHRRVGELCMRQVDEEREEVAFLEERVGREASQRVRARRIVLRGLGADLRRWGGSRVETERRNLDTVQRELNGSVSRRLSLLKREVEAATSPLAGGRLSRQLAHRRDVLDDVSRRLLGAMERRLRDDPEVEGMRGRLAASTKRLERQRHELDGLRGRLGGAVSRQLARQRELVDSLESRRNGLDPMRVLERGFALVTDASGALVRDAGRVARGEQLRVRLASGELSARRIDDPVENVEGGE